MQLIPEYKKYSKLLGIYTLAIRIRQYSWWIQELLKSINSNKKKLKSAVSKIKKRLFFSNISEINNTSNLLASELRRWMTYLKIIYFHDSAILHLQLRILLKIYDRIEQKKKQIINLRKHTKDKQQIRIVNNKLKQLQKEIGDISKADEAIIHSLREFKIGFNKILRKGFSIKTFTILKEWYVNKRIKIKAKTIKDIELKRKGLMSKLNLENEKTVKRITNMLEKEIKAVEKDVLYDRQLIIKLQNKKKHIQNILKHLEKKLLKMKIDKKNVDKIILNINQPFRELDNLIDEDINKMFRNALRQLNRSALLSKKIS